MKRNRNASSTKLASVPLTIDRDTSMRDRMRDSLKCYTLPPEELKALNDRLGPKPEKKKQKRCMIIPAHQRGGGAA